MLNTNVSNNPVNLRLDTPVARMFLVTAALTLLAQFVAGQHAVPLFGRVYIAYEIGIFFVFGSASALLFLADSARLASNFTVEGGGQVKIGSLWRTIRLPGAEALLLLTVAAFGIASSGNLAELYRASASTWHDQLLWSREGGLISLLIQSPVNFPQLWDLIYQLLWLVVFLSLADIARNRDMATFAEALCAVIFAFHVTRYISISFPTAGPVFYHHELFNVTGTATAAQVKVLQDFMAGIVPPSGMLPGTQAFPSLHVGLAWCAVVFMARMKQLTLWLTVPWFLLNWASTVFLGWHYVIDGIGGILVMTLSIYLSKWIFNSMQICRRRTETPNEIKGQGV